MLEKWEDHRILEKFRYEKWATFESLVHFHFGLFFLNLCEVCERVSVLFFVCLMDLRGLLCFAIIGLNGLMNLDFVRLFFLVKALFSTMSAL